MVHAGGRPRTTSPHPAQCEDLGKDLLEWASEETDEWRCLLGQWWSGKQFMTRHVWNCLKQTKEFLPYYEAAQQIMAVKAVKGTMKEGFGHRYIRLYDRELIDAENAQAGIDAELRKSINKNGDGIEADIRSIAQALQNIK